MTAFAKCRIKGPKAEEFLDYLVANKLPRKLVELIYGTHLILKVFILNLQL